jgi:hypothetical protein
MDQLEDLAALMLHLVWKWCLPLLPTEATVKQLINMINLRQSPDPSLACHLPQRPEAKMPQTGMPSPRRLFCACQETNWLCNVDVEHKKPIRRALNLRNQTILDIPDIH